MTGEIERSNGQVINETTKLTTEQNRLTREKTEHKGKRSDWAMHECWMIGS
jgi:hypothetical protein